MSRRVSIIVLTWNGLDYSKKCLSSLLERTRYDNYELVVVDNGSTDGTVPYLRALAGIRLIENPTNLGFAKGNNVGLAGIDHDVILLNNDIIITQDDWIEKLQDAAYAADDVGVVVCRLTSPDGHLHHAGSFVPVETFRGQQLAGGQLDVGQHNLVREVESGVAAVMYIRRECLAEVGPLDPDYFSYFEDTDYCLKARAAGFKVLYTGEVSLLHFQNTSVAVNKVDFGAMYGESRQIFLSKWASYFKEKYTQEVVWHSWFFRPIGYGTYSRNATTALEELGVKVHPRFLNPAEADEPVAENEPFHDIQHRTGARPAIEVCHAWGDLFFKNEGRVKIGYTMLEVDGLPEEWVRQANTMDLVWVPSTFNEGTFREAGVTRPIVRMPQGYDPNYFNPGIKSYRADDRFTFLSIFEWGERKAPEVLLRAFTEEFSKDEDVQLIVKTSNSDPHVNIPKQVRELNLRTGRAPVVIDINRHVPAHQMGALYRSADAFVFPTRGEGWGFPLMEAMACGLPAIATNWSGLTSFFHDGIGYPVDYKLVPAVARCPYYQGFNWAEPDVAHLRAQMRHVYDNHQAARAKGLLAAAEMRETFALSVTAAHMKQRLAEAASLLSPVSR